MRNFLIEKVFDDKINYCFINYKGVFNYTVYKRLF